MPDLFVSVIDLSLSAIRNADEGEALVCGSVIDLSLSAIRNAPVRRALLAAV